MLSNSEEECERAGLPGAIEFTVTIWAVSGGCVLLAVILINVTSILGGIFWKPFPGDFELTEIGVAVAAFSFLPYCQIIGANVTADIFTAKVSPRWIAFFKFAASLVAVAFALLLIWRMSAGMLSQRHYGYTTAILQIPIWWAYIPSIFSLVLLVPAALVTCLEGFRALLNEGTV